jgi:elongation factor 2
MAEPLGDELTKAIEEEKVSSMQESRERSQILASEFGWDSNDAKKIWCFGPETTGPNVLVDMTSQAQYLREIRDSIEAGFQWVTNEGVLTHEN